MDKKSELCHWNNIKIAIKEKYPFLNKSDLRWRDGETKEDLLKNLSYRIGISLKEFTEFINQQ